MRSRHTGFTLIELMMTIAIIGVLASMAMPSFQDRVIRAQVSEGIELTEFVRQSIGAYYQRHKTMPADNTAAGLPDARSIVGNYVQEVRVVDGAVNIRYGNRSNRFLAGKTLSLRPAVVPEQPIVPIAWECGHAVAPDSMKVLGANATDIPLPNLPIDCRI
jgi:type IV pilus assembly protein PilA